MNNIIYLYAEIMPYQTIIFKTISSFGHKVIAFSQKKDKLTPYVPEEIPNVEYIYTDNMAKKELMQMVKELNPNILVVAGWSNKKYLYIAREIKKLGISVVCPIDTQYLHTFKQKIGFLISPFYIKNSFTHIWVPGSRQYEFAKRLGFSNSNIIFNSLSGNINLFSSVPIKLENEPYPKRLIYVGRFNEVKGLKLLIKAWDNILNKKGWRLTLIGNGPLKETLNLSKSIEILDFKSQEELIIIAKEAGALILPSLYEPWALVIHEFAATGLPIICSEACGSITQFVIPNYNGYTFKTNNILDLENKLNLLFSKSTPDLIKMGKNSKTLAKRITPELSVHSLLSIIS